MHVNCIISDPFFSTELLKITLCARKIQEHYTGIEVQTRISDAKLLVISQQHKPLGQSSPFFNH